jgi:adenylate kinase family enzyme
MVTRVSRTRIHIFGASGSGTSTIGRALAKRHGLTCFEADEFFWEATDPPYRHARERAERQRLLTEALSATPQWVLAGSLTGWGDVAISRFELAVFVTTPTALRLERLRARESARLGARLLESGDMYQQHQEFLTWASQYDHGGMDIRSRRLHEDWLSRLPCPVVRIDGSGSVDAACAQVCAAITV